MRRVSAREFLNGLNDFFHKIGTLHENVISLAPHPTHEKIRIVVLDSGVDDMDSLIRFSLKSGRINTRKSRSFVGREHKWWQDTHGHGTHVTRLLLNTAPAAEIYVGKICTRNVISDGSMPEIAKVSLPLNPFQL